MGQTQIMKDDFNTSVISSIEGYFEHRVDEMTFVELVQSVVVDDVLGVFDQTYVIHVFFSEVLKNPFELSGIKLDKFAIQERGALIEDVIVRLRIKNVVFLKNVSLFNLFFYDESHETK